jgi:hypothetical protein
MKYITLYPQMTERGQRAEALGIACHEGIFVELLNKEMEELLKSIENNKELKKLYENNSTNSKGVKNEKERN